MHLNALILKKHFWLLILKTVVLLYIFVIYFEINILQNNDLRLLTLEIKSTLNLETTNSLKIMLLLKETIMLDLFLHFQFISWEQKKIGAAYSSAGHIHVNLVVIEKRPTHTWLYSALGVQ